MLLAQRSRLFPVLTLAAFGLAACATPAPETASTATFAQFDADGDQFIDQPEFINAFDRFDLDGNRVIDAQENAAIVYEADGDRDGVVTLEEFGRIDITRLEADANLDGRISRAELELYEREDRAAVVNTTPGVTSSYGRLQPEARWVQFRF